MILLDFLLSLTPAAKEKWKDIKLPNRSVQYGFTLSPEDVRWPLLPPPAAIRNLWGQQLTDGQQEAWATKTKSQISFSLQPDQTGKLFMRLINTVLAREQNWVHWKAEGCHQFDLPALDPAEFVDANARVTNHCKPERPFPYLMGTPTLNRLWVDTGRHLDLADLMDTER